MLHVHVGPAFFHRAAITGQAGADHARGGDPSRNIERLQQRGAIQCHRQRLAVFLGRQETPGVGYVEAEQADRRIQPHGAPAQPAGIGQRQGCEFAAQDNFIAPLSKATGCAGRIGRGDLQLQKAILETRLHRKAAIFRSQRIQHSDPFAAPQPHRTGTGTPHGDAEFGLGEQLQEARHRALQPDFHDPAGHCADIADLVQIHPQAGAVEAFARCAQRIADRLRGQPCSVGQVEFPDAKDIAAAIVGNDPTFRDGRHHLARLVDGHEPLHRRGTDMLAGKTQPEATVEQLVFIADDGDLEHPVIARLRARDEEPRQEKEQGGAHGCAAG